jgi:hypothetical protein
MLAALSVAVDDQGRVRSERITSEKHVLWRTRDRAIHGVVLAGKASYDRLRHPRRRTSSSGDGEQAPLLG